MFEAKLYDGITAHRHDAHADMQADAILLRQDSGWTDQVAKSLLHRLDGDGSTIRLGRTDIDGWRLILPPEARVAVSALLGGEERYGRWIDRIGLLPALAVFGVLAAGVLLVGHFAPQWVAPHVPEQWERNVGDAIVGDFGDNRCRNPAGQRALEAMAERLEPGSTRGPNRLRLAALDINMFNAAALPGGHIVVFKTAITETEDPDALAGVLAHEIAHVRRRHVTQALIRELGIGALIRLFAGDIGANAQQIVALNYTRSNEAEADSDAIVMLRRAGISPKPTAALFRKLGEHEADGSSYNAEFLQSHPLSSNRARKFDTAFDANTRYTRALTQSQADDLFNICWKR
ncbi:MAG: M48 family metallopeptidase [Sphingomicrobium sp.]